MRRAFWGRMLTGRGLIVRSIAFVAPFLVAVALGSLSTESYGQQLPSGALQQLQQQFQLQGGQSRAGIPAVPDLPSTSVIQPAIVMPAVPEYQNSQPSRLEQIMSQRAGTRLRLFGYDTLGAGRSVTVAQSGGIQDDYVLGPGDEIVVSLRGQENLDTRVMVSRNGQVVLPRLNPIAATGRTFGGFREDVEAAVRRAYVATSAFVSLGTVRQVNVLVVGQVNVPGQRTLSGLSSVVDAILLSGGVKRSGSLRNIHVQRRGREFNVDLYSVISDTGRSSSNLRLADGDRIVVPLLGSTVAITGLVRQPGIYELPAGRKAISARSLIDLAGGKEVQGRYRISLQRILPDGRTRLVKVPGEDGIVRDSEVLFVQIGADQVVSQATLSGGTGLAGAYPVAAGTRLSDMLKAPGALGASPYTPFGLIVRKNRQTLALQLIAFTPSAVLKSHEDEVLQSEDIVRVLSINEARLLNFVSRSYLTRLAQDQNRIRNPMAQVVPESSNSLYGRLASQRGQVTELEDTSSVPAYIQRQDITGLLNIPAPDSERGQFLADSNNRDQNSALAMQSGRTDNSPNADTQRDDGMDDMANDAAMSSNGFDSRNAGGLAGAGNRARAGQERYSANGDLLFSNRQADEQYDQETTANFTEQVVSSGGYALNREAHTFGELSRQLGVDPLVLINFLIGHRVRLDGAVLGPDSYLAGPSATLEDLVQAAGGTVNWANESGVELISTIVDRDTGRAVTIRKSLPLRTGMLASYVVHPRDQFRFSQVSTDVGVGSVTVQGEVRYPGTFPILRGEHLSDLLARAGGLTTVAYPYGTVYLRKSAAQAERQSYTRAADEIQSQLVVAMTRIGNSKLEPATFTAMQSFVSELRNREALGRVSFVADPKALAANPSSDPLLEAGDVIYIPSRPSTVAVLGEVLQPGNFAFKKSATLDDYVEQAGGYAATADESHTYIVLPNGEARRVSRSWLSASASNLPPGSSIVVPRDVTPLDLRQTILDISQIFSQFAISIASIAVLSRQ